MEKYVVSRELAEKLKEAGFKQSGIYYHYQKNGPDSSHYGLYRAGNLLWVEGSSSSIAAPLSDELLEQLPDYTKIFRKNKGDEPRMSAGVISQNVNDPTYVNGHVWRNAQKHPDSLAELWLYCKEHGLLDGGQGEK